MFKKGVPQPQQRQGFTALCTCAYQIIVTIITSDLDKGTSDLHLQELSNK